MSLKQKTVSGLAWSFIDNFVNLGIQFIVGVILARLLSPNEFGLIGMLTIFIAVSQSFIDSGFKQALIRKKDPTQADYSTVFYYNMLLGIITYLLLFISADLIGRFFNEPQLKQLIRVLGLSLIINAFCIIQQTLLAKRIDFRLQAKISIISSVVSGAVAIIMAFAGYGVWSLVIKTITTYLVISILIWVLNEWRPSLIFSVSSIRELFAFGSNLLISGLIDTIYRNVYYIVIGKYFSARELGYYTTAEQFNNLPSSNLSTVVQRVSYPVLSSIKEDMPKLREAYKKLIKSTMFICFVLMLGLFAVSRNLILALIGLKWETSIVYLQMLCFVGMFHPLHALNLNMLQVEGRSDLFLRIEIIKKTLAVPVIIVGVFLGIKALIISMIIVNIFAYFLNSHWSGRFLGYSSWEQLADIFPSFIIAGAVSLAVLTEGIFLDFPPALLLTIQLLTGAALTIVICETIKFKDYIYIKEVVRDNFIKKKSYD
jgi:O-antigen/teichoic acid export membrane protein